MHKLLAMIILPILVLSLWSNRALAGEPPPEGPVETPSGGPPLGPPPGYRIDEPSPGAVVHRVRIRPLDTDAQVARDILPMSIYRSGWTDGWFEWFYPHFWDHVGSHTSDSDLTEDQIWVDGFQRRVGMNGWWATCEDHKQGYSTAHCNSVKRLQIFYTFYAESHHTFRTAGYQDDYFETGKTINAW